MFVIEFRHKATRRYFKSVPGTGETQIVHTAPQEFLSRYVIPDDYPKTRDLARAVLFSEFADDPAFGSVEEVSCLIVKGIVHLQRRIV